MRYFALASDYDGTLAHDGVVDEQTLEKVQAFKHSGRKFILVTGREIPDLERAFPRLDLCDRVVAENGAVLYDPATREKRVLATAPPQAFIDKLRSSGVDDLSVGDVIVATWRPHETEVLNAIQELGLELQIIFNKEAVMVLPSGVNKSTGLQAALEELKLSLHNVVGVGDAENDHAFLHCCECSVAVANALPSLKEQVALVTTSERGAGVSELISRILHNDLIDVRTRGSIPLGHSDHRTVQLDAYGRTVLVCGQSGSGKSTFVAGLLERITEQDYSVCLIDPEGDYEGLSSFRVLGTEQYPPSLREFKNELADSPKNLVVNLIAVSGETRPHCFASILATVQENRLHTGQPHWIVVDEAHHVLPSDWAPTSEELGSELSNLVLITVHPEHVSPCALSKVNTVIVVGPQPGVLLNEFARTVGRTIPANIPSEQKRGHLLLWSLDDDQVLTLEAEHSRIQHDRHKRKYAEGQLEDERIFHFRGPDQKMDLQAHNLTTFVQLARGLDTETWQYHLKRGDFSSWMRSAVKDEELAVELEQTERNSDMSDRDTRSQIIVAIERKYTSPA